MTGVLHLEVELVLDAQAELGEGPVWDAREGVLFWVDINGERVHRFDPRTGKDVSIEVGEPVGALAPRAGGGLVLALKSGFAALDSWDGRSRLVTPVEADREDTRMNDGACDTHGRFWAGTMHVESQPGHGSLYRLDPDWTLERLVDDITCSNGIGWSPDDTRMYYVDTAAGSVDVFDYDAGTGAVGNRRVLVGIEPGAGVPDGLVVDAEGFIWVALWDGWAIRRYSPAGVLASIVDVPVARVTKCAFGGPALDELFITTAQPNASSGDQPNAGGIFHTRPGVTGLPATPFAG